MNLILLFKEDFTSQNTVRLEGRRFSHIRKVNRAGKGDFLTVGLEGGMTGKGEILSVNRDSLEMAVTLVDSPPPPLPLTLILALPRPKAFRRILQTVTAMGVKKIFLINTWRVEKSYWQSPMLEENDLKEQLVLGLEQAKDTLLPQIIKKKLFKPFVEDELPDLTKGTLSLVAHPYKASSFPVFPGRPVTLAIGPEGGFIPFEIEKLEECGFTPVTPGARILKVETIIPALLSRLY